MDDKKNENEKVMKYINAKLKQGEIPLMLVDTMIFGKSCTQQAKMVITSNAIYFIQNMSVKRYIKVDLIQFIALTPHCNQMIIFFDPKGDQSTKDMVRIQSLSNVRIVQDILSVREKFCEIRAPLPIMISGSKNLQSVVNTVQSANKSFFGFFSKKKEGIVDLQNRLSVQGDILYVYQKDFAIQIGQRMYNLIYKNVKLLYMNSSETFRFYEQRYICEQINPSKKLYRWKNTQQKSASKKQAIKLKKIQASKNVLLRKIEKQSAEQNKKIAEDLKKYKNQEYKQEILFATQTETHFQILTTLNDQQKDCQLLLISHQYLTEKDLRSIYFKLIQMIQSSNQIFYSLSPQNIIVSKQGVRISKLFSCIKRYQQADYIAPEELFKDSFTRDQIQLVNLWKVGILIFQLAYGNVPFPIEYIISKLRSKNKQLQLKLPTYSLRTLQFQNFIKAIIKFQPNQRGKISMQGQQTKLNESLFTQNQSFIKVAQTKQNWRNSLRTSKWVRYHQSIKI